MKVKAARDIYVTDLLGGEIEEYTGDNFGGFAIPWDRETGLFVSEGTDGVLVRERVNGMAADIKFEGRELFTFLADMYDIV